MYRLYSNVKVDVKIEAVNGHLDFICRKLPSAKKKKKKNNQRVIFLAAGGVYSALHKSLF